MPYIDVADSVHVLEFSFALSVQSPMCAEEETGILLYTYAFGTIAHGNGFVLSFQTFVNFWIVCHPNRMNSWFMSKNVFVQRSRIVRVARS